MSVSVLSRSPAKPSPLEEGSVTIAVGDFNLLAEKTNLRAEIRRNGFLVASESVAESDAPSGEFLLATALEVRFFAQGILCGERIPEEFRAEGGLAVDWSTDRGNWIVCQAEFNADGSRRIFRHFRTRAYAEAFLAGARLSW